MGKVIETTYKSTSCPLFVLLHKDGKHCAVHIPKDIPNTFWLVVSPELGKALIKEVGMKPVQNIEGPFHE